MLRQITFVLTLVLCFAASLVKGKYKSFPQKIKSTGQAFKRWVENIFVRSSFVLVIVVFVLVFVSSTLGAGLFVAPKIVPLDVSVIHDFLSTFFINIYRA